MIGEATSNGRASLLTKLFTTHCATISSYREIMNRTPPNNLECSFTDNLNRSFRRALTGAKFSRWLHLVNRLMDIELVDKEDPFRWGLNYGEIYYDELHGGVNLTKLLKK
jgi:hypothetical protein